MCKDADVYVQAVLRPDLVRQIPSLRVQDILDYHSTVEQAGQTAQRAAVKKLVLTHCIPSVQPGEEGAWRALAERHFDGEVHVGDDLLAVEA